MGEHVVRTVGGVAIDGRAVTKSQRPLVAALALARRHGATIDMLIDAVWPTSVPRSARQSIQNQVARLRSSFGADLIATTADRYRLTPATDVDALDRVAHLCDRTMLTPDEVDAVVAVLDNWHGEPYAELPDHPLAQAERARLHHVQRRLIETVALQRLTDPRADHHTAIVELTMRTSTDPLHEQAWELMVVALHRAGRRTEALEAYARFAEHLDQQLGAAPSRRFQQLDALVKADEVVDPAFVFFGTGAVSPIPLRATA
jgi:DNA-binding SARP family transcriptional activator